MDCSWDSMYLSAKSELEEMRLWLLMTTLGLTNYYLMYKGILSSFPITFFTYSTLISSWVNQEANAISWMSLNLELGSQNSYMLGSNYACKTQLVLPYPQYLLFCKLNELSIVLES